MSLKIKTIPVSLSSKGAWFLMLISLALSLSCAGFPQTPGGDSEWERVEESPAPVTESPVPSPQEPVIQETETVVRIELSGDILFDFDKWDIRPGAEVALKDVAGVIKKYPDSSILIEGYTDSKGSDSYNVLLSGKRAEAVRNWLVKREGIDGKEIITRGRGEAKPAAPNTNADGSDNPGGRRKNRRVEITVRK